MQARISNPAQLLPDAMKPLMALAQLPHGHGVSAEALELAHLRASQINGCAWCVDYGWTHARKAGETEQRLAAVSTWRESPHFTDDERAALELAEVITRMSDRSDPVPDEVWARAAEHFDEEALAALVLSISVTNLYNRINVATKRVPGEW